MTRDPSAPPPAPVLLTGASGRLGRVLAPALAARGWQMRLTDRVAFPDPLPPGASFTRADLHDAPALATLAQGCAAVLHFGGRAAEDAFEEILDSNLRGNFTVFEAARRAGCRVVYASSNHAFGFHPRDELLDSDCAFRPDGLYGLSKAYGELLARLYWDKHGVESISIRIGSCYPVPRNQRMLITWLAPEDLVELVCCAVLAESPGCLVVWGCSANKETWWRGDDRARIGWQPTESSERFSDVPPESGADDPIARRFQGGAMCSRLSARAGTLPEDQ